MARESCRFFGLAFVASFVILVAVRAQSNGTLRVSVIDNRGFPDPNAALTLVSEDRLRKAKVNEAGEFEFADLGFESYELEISSPSFKDVTIPNIQITSPERKVLKITEELYTTVPIKPPTRCTLFDIAVLSGLGQRLAYEERTDKANFTGTIADAVTGKPVIGATIILYKAGSADNVLPAAKSDEKGKFEFSDVAPGKYTFSVSHEGYLAETVDFQFWITRQNLTRLGRISLNPKSLQLNCDPVMEVRPEFHSNPIPPPELIPPPYAR
jgi:Carboxypeptidase regulatory-like domain